MTTSSSETASSTRLDPALAAGNRRPLAGYAARHFAWSVSEEGIARITLSRPERKNPLTFDSYAELRELFERLRHAPDVHAVVLAGSGGNFCSGGDVHEIIGPLVKLKAPELLMFTRMTGDVVKAMRVCPQPIIAAIDGVCAGAGAILAMASDLRLGTARSKKGQSRWGVSFMGEILRFAQDDRRRFVSRPGTPASASPRTPRRRG